MTQIRTIDPKKAAEMVRQGAVIVDVRSADEFARAHIPGARNQALDTLTGGAIDHKDAPMMIFHCRSGARTQANAAVLAQAAQCEAFILEGGIEGWKEAGLPVEEDRSQPLELMRQVQIAAGGLVLLGVLLGAFVAPGFYALSAFVGAGLVFAGATGWCGMARLLAVMPWNRRAEAVAGS
jgi:rhodanese-related sulfurtransferase